MQINNVTITDIDQIYSFYRIASDYQKAKEKVIVWPDFNRNMVETEIAEHRQFKMLMNNEVVCIWAITFNDEQIWEERNRDSAIYIHRIATNPDFRGRNFVSKIVDWAKEYAKEKGIQFIRLDTLGNNTRLIKHYKNAGFDFLGMFDLKNTDSLPDHYKEAPVCLFEIDLES
ncbi:MULTISPECIES: GNAT family N-acetyltransferase [unclassified Polaribacter]|jgi:ribosomal protein S18 acetylase RimI-like enzyme|uniref:GNAT family N-acetyltransferase n=1 Tax=unclassified Polaribacter TaxID=196858 RepID=UPI00052D040C|nr:MULTISPECIES: GNAT family N-acetyltransferase [unclassified Polaribacter]KGL59207.1 GCN5-related protein N-acetyltransferase [Polaribacter sp. Hel1_33_49]MBT3740860.1 GNAT family N-acetyltransferase [Polaribacter sp.]MBT7815491.1 GNAT family N-acetyltransferase [Polaribacter sp.]MDG1196016.1 GNAT family N-acetyltransferase [Polaribacter sp.]MDG1403815.1 GNAT family N-acetyltransferase [Polaribacter sp.]